MREDTNYIFFSIWDAVFHGSLMIKTDPALRILCTAQIISSTQPQFSNKFFTAAVNAKVRSFICLSVFQPIKLPAPTTPRNVRTPQIYGKFYRVPCDKRDLNYDKYFKDGDANRNLLTEFNSNNTELLSVTQVKQKLLSLNYIRSELEMLGIK